eukprot:732728-Pelagomonas_calceolata.AAC.4
MVVGTWCLMEQHGVDYAQRFQVAGSAAVVTGRAGFGVWAAAFRSVGVAGTAPALGGTVDVVGACAAGTAAVVYVGGAAGNAAAAVGG